MASVTQLYLEKCRTKLSTALGKEATDYALAKVLGITQPSMSRYMKGENPAEADDDTAFMIAQYAQVPPMEIIGAIRAKRAKKKETREFWEKAKKGVVAGVGAVSLAGAMMTNPAPAEASTNLQKFNINNQTDYILYELMIWSFRGAYL